MPKKSSNFIDYSNPAELLSSYDNEILEGKINLYGWQVEVSDWFAELNSEVGKQNEIDVVAANESGKSKMLVAPCALWATCQYDMAETVITTASGSQLDRQTARYIKDYARRMNTFHGDDEMWTIQHRLLKFKPTDGTMDLFATDEAGKAEGWHQRGFDTAFSIIVDEAKSVSDEVFTALDRCHDAQRVLRVSSPAIGTNGYFYKAVTSGRSRVRKITAYECKHISRHQIEKIIQTYGLHSPITKSIIFAEFSSTDEQVVISYDTLLKLLNSPKKPLLNQVGQPIRVGGDLAAGGDENVISVWQGNRQLALECFREPDTTLTVVKIIAILGKYKVPKDSDFIFMDDGGVGRSIIDQLRAQGWNITRVLNQSAPINNKMFSNRGAELWFNFATFIENEELLFLTPYDETLISQLSNRYYKQSSTGKILLESKRDAKAHGHPSPDRADATVLAFTGLIAPYFSLVGNEQQNQKKVGSFATLNPQELIEAMDQITYAGLPGFTNFSRREHVEINNSMQLLLEYPNQQEYVDRWNNIAEELSLYNLILNEQKHRN